VLPEVMPAILRAVSVLPDVEPAFKPTVYEVPLVHFTVIVEVASILADSLKSCEPKSRSLAEMLQAFLTFNLTSKVAVLVSALAGAERTETSAATSAVRMIMVNSWRVSECHGLKQKPCQPHESA
jgi:hypothetical protein